MSDWSFFNIFGSDNTLKLESKIMHVMNFPGGYGVAAVEGKHLFPSGEFKASSMDLFICAEKAIEALETVSKSFSQLLKISCSCLTKSTKRFWKR